MNDFEPQWYTRYDEYTKKWQVWFPQGKPSSEGTQPLVVVAECSSYLYAEQIMNFHNKYIKVSK